MSRDPEGYYAILGLSPGAGDEEIKQAYRQRAKQLHPDRNPDPDAEDTFRKVSLAYQVLSDPRARQTYMKRAHRETGNHDRKGYAPCCDCGVVSAQPRVVGFSEVAAWGIRARVRKISGTFCSSCARRAALKASGKTWLLGWWAPTGPYKSIRALWQNLKGGHQPRAENYALLMDQAEAFLESGKTDLAAAAAEQARKFAPDGEKRRDVENFLSALAGCPPRQMVNSWRRFGGTQVLIPLTLVAVIAAILSTGHLPSHQSGRPRPPTEMQPVFSLPGPKNNPDRLYIVKRDGGVPLRYGPSSAADTVHHVPRGTPVLLTGLVPESPWVRIETDNGDSGFITFSAIEKVAGKD